MTTYYWVAGPGSWTDADHWSLYQTGHPGGDGVPTTGDAVVISGYSGLSDGDTITDVQGTLSSFESFSPATLAGIGTNDISLTVTGNVTIADTTGGDHSKLNLTLTPSSDVDIRINGTIKSLTVQGANSSTAPTVSIATFSGETITGALTLSGYAVILDTDASNTVTVGSFVTSQPTTGAAGTTHTVTCSAVGSSTFSDSAGTNNLIYTTIDYTNVTGGATWTLGVGSVDAGNNTGFVVSASGKQGLFGLVA